jgi:hypothetical protein
MSSPPSTSIEKRSRSGVISAFHGTLNGNSVEVNATSPQINATD